MELLLVLFARYREIFVNTHIKRERDRDRKRERDRYKE
jgi:hypothetical protein